MVSTQARAAAEPQLIRHGSLSPRVVGRAAELAQQFAAGVPFPHVVVDGLFAGTFAAGLLETFPSPVAAQRLRQGGRSARRRLRSFGPDYAGLDALASSQPFLALLEQISGIHDLRCDTDYRDGVVRELRHGEEWGLHVDADRHPSTGWYRRLELIVFLNREWDDAWGGSLELRRDPRCSDDHPRIVTPLFGRTVLFATGARSWHGSPRVDLPPDERHLSCRSIALSFYTRQPGADRDRDRGHAAMWADWPLPRHLQPGHVLNVDDVEALRALLAQRDRHVERLYDEHAARCGGRAERARWTHRLGRLRLLVRRLLGRRGAR